MAELPSVFKPSENHSMTLPASWYPAKLVKSELKITKDKAGKYLSMGFKVTQGPRGGALVWTNLNLVNKNDTAVRIAESDLEKIATACGVEEDFTDSEVLHGIEIAIKVTIKPATSQFPEGNEIKDYKAIEDVEFDDLDAEPDSPFAGFEDKNEAEA